jgi:hypothetical protein
MDDERRDDGERPDPGAAPTLGNAVYRWADRTIKPLPYGVRITIVGLIITFLVVLPIVLFVMLIART